MRALLLSPGVSGNPLLPAAAARTITRVPTPIFQHPLAYLAGIEGVALLRAFAGEHDEAFTRTRLAELRLLLADPDRWGPGAEVVPLGAREAYDGWAPHYDGPNSIFELEGPALRPILDALPPGAAVDAACGIGRIAAYLHDRGHCVQGYDVSPGMLAVARAKLRGVPFAEADVRALPVADASVDLVVITLALAHLEDLGPVFAEAGRVLRPGDHLVVSDIRTTSSARRSTRCLRRRPTAASATCPHGDTAPGSTSGRLCPTASRCGPARSRSGRRWTSTTGDPPEPHGPGEPPNVWALMGAVPEAARATYLDTPALLVWDFVRRPGPTS